MTTTSTLYGTAVSDGIPSGSCHVSHFLHVYNFLGQRADAVHSHFISSHNGDTVHINNVEREAGKVYILEATQQPRSVSSSPYASWYMYRYTHIC